MLNKLLQSFAAIFLLCALLMSSCRNDCDSFEPKMELFFETNLMTDTISVGDTINVRMEIDQFLESPDHPSPIDMIDQDWRILYTVSAIIDLNEEGEFFYDHSVDFVLNEGFISSPTILSKSISPTFNDGSKKFELDFDLVFSEAGSYLAIWNYNSLLDDDVQSLECDQLSFWNFTQNAGSKNHYLLEHIPEEYEFREQIIQRKDIDGAFGVVVE